MKPSVKKAVLLSPLFKGIDEETASELLKSNLVFIKEIEKGEKIFTERDFSRSLGIIAKGEARVEKCGGAKTVIMSTLSAGGTFGMAALFHEEITYPTSITALKNTTVVFLPKVWLTESFIEVPTLAENYIALLSAKIHFLTGKIETLSLRGDNGKLYSYILSEYKKHGDNKKVTLSYNMAELSKVLGIGRTTLYREFDELISGDLIYRNGKTITILNSEDLL